MLLQLQARGLQCFFASKLQPAVSGAAHFERLTGEIGGEREREREGRGWCCQRAVGGYGIGYTYRACKGEYKQQLHVVIHTRTRAGVRC